jgi:hypothetical protein
MWRVLPRRTQRPISMSKDDIKTPKTKIIGSNKGCPKGTGMLQQVRRQT